MEVKEYPGPPLANTLMYNYISCKVLKTTVANKEYNSG